MCLCVVLLGVWLYVTVGGVMLELGAVMRKTNIIYLIIYIYMCVCVCVCVFVCVCIYIYIYIYSAHPSQP